MRAGEHSDRTRTGEKHKERGKKTLAKRKRTRTKKKKKKKKKVKKERKKEREREREERMQKVERSRGIRFYTRLNQYVDVYIVSACRVAFQGVREGEGEGIETGI